MRFSRLSVCLCAILMCKGATALDLDLLRIDGEASATAGPNNTTNAGTASDSFVDAPDYGLADGAVLPAQDNDQSPTAQATAAASEISGFNQNIGANGNAWAILEVQGNGSDGWLRATISLQTAESGAQTSGGGSFGDAGLWYQAGILFAVVPYQISDPIDSGSQLKIEQYVEDLDLITVHADATAGMAPVGYSSTNMSVTAAGKVEAAASNGGNPNSARWVKNGITGGHLDY